MSKSKGTTGQGPQKGYPHEQTSHAVLRLWELRSTGRLPEQCHSGSWQILSCTQPGQQQNANHTLVAEFEFTFRRRPVLRKLQKCPPYTKGSEQTTHEALVLNSPAWN